jgi:hypothetical protein
MRTRRVEFFNWDGSSAGPPKAFTRPLEGFRNNYLSPYEYAVEGVAFQEPVPTGNPSLSWNAIPLFPLSHPLVAWLLVICGLAASNLPRLKEYWMQ